MKNSAVDITGLLVRVQEGDADAFAVLFQSVYNELRRVARRYMRAERKGHSLQPTALVNEAYLRMMKSPPPGLQNRSHFFAFAARVIRQVLVDHARGVRASKRTGGKIRVDFDSVLVYRQESPEELLAIDVALKRLAELDERQARIVELRFFVGLSNEEIAVVMGLSRRTVQRDWEMAKAWLYGELKPRQDGGKDAG